MELKILIADDHKLILNGIKALIENEPDFIVIGEAHDGRTAVKMACDLKPDIVIMDISMPKLNGIEAIEELQKLNSNLKIIVLSMHLEKKIISGALQAGAKGYLLKDCATSDLVSAIRSVWKGHTFLSPQIAESVVKGFIGMTDIPLRPASELSSREREVLQLLAEGYSIVEIADLLNISNKTVESHKANIMKKLNTKNIVEIIKYALKENLISIEQWLASAKI